MTLFITLNDDGSLALESDYSGSRQQIISDDEGPTDWEWDPALEVPERVNYLVREWVESGLSGSQPATGDILDVMIDHQTQNIVDDR